jgi:hypothetical protein
VQAAVTRRLAAGDPAYRGLLGQAGDLDRTAGLLEELPDGFWREA